MFATFLNARESERNTTREVSGVGRGFIAHGIYTAREEDRPEAMQRAIRKCEEIMRKQEETNIAPQYEVLRKQNSQPPLGARTSKMHRISSTEAELQKMVAEFCENNPTAPTEGFGKATAGKKQSGVDMGNIWSLDSGASWNMVDRRNQKVVRERIAANVRMDTVQGEVGISDGAMVEMPSVAGSHKAVVIDNKSKNPVNCISMGYLVEELDCEVHWKRGECKLNYPDGSSRRVPVINNVPTMGLTGTQASEKETKFERALQVLKEIPDCNPRDVLNDFADTYNDYMKTLDDFQDSLKDFQAYAAKGAKRPRRDGENHEPPEEQKDVEMEDVTLSDEKAENEAKKPEAKKKGQRKVNRLRYELAETQADLDGDPKQEEMLIAKPDAGELSVDHFLDHTPADMRCSVCRDAKGKVSAAFRIPEDEGKEKRHELPPLDFCGCDLIGQTDPDFYGNTMLLNTHDFSTEYPRVVAIDSKEPPDVTEAYVEVFPGTRYDEEPTCPRNLGIDGGTEFKAEFLDHLKKCGTTPVYGLPRRSNTHAVMERKNQDLIYGTISMLVTAGACYKFWSMAARHFAFNKARRPDGRGDNKAPYVRHWKREHTHLLVPFGCKCTFFDDTARKFDIRRQEGVIVGYAPLAGYRVLDFAKYKDEKKVRILETRDVQVDRFRFPLRGVKHEDAELSMEPLWKIIERRGAAPDAYVDTANRLRCRRCKLLISDEPITCKVCLGSNRLKHGKGRPGPGCRLSRCKGHGTGGEQAAVNDDDDGFNMEHEPVRKPPSSSASSSSGGPPAGVSESTDGAGGD